MRAGSVKQKIFCSVAIKIKIVCGPYVTVGPTARPYPPPSRIVDHADCPQQPARSHAAHYCMPIHHCISIHTVQAYILYAHPPLYKPTRQAGLWVIVGHCFLITHNHPRGKKPGNKKRGRGRCGSLWVMWAVILNRRRSRVLHSKCSTTENLNYLKTITHNHPQIAQTRMFIGFVRGSLSAFRHPQNNPRQPTKSLLQTVTNIFTRYP